MKQIELNSKSSPLVEQWKAAKKAEQAWIAHRRYLEEQIAAAHAAEFEQIKSELPGLSSTVKLGDLDLNFNREFEVDQAEAALFLAQHPSLLGVVLKSEYKSVAKGALSALPKMEGLQKVLTFKPIRVYFSGNV